MDGFLTALKGVFDSLGATIALPIIIFFIALILGAKPGKAFRAGVYVGIAFIGINLVIGLMWGALSSVGQALVTNLNITRDVLDVGWPSAAAIAFGSKVGLWVIPIAILVNVVFLSLRLTKTLNVDVWNLLALRLHWFDGGCSQWQPDLWSDCRRDRCRFGVVPGRLDREGCSVFLWIARHFNSTSHNSTKRSLCHRHKLDRGSNPWVE